jgi:hypothetical protein
LCKKDEEEEEDISRVLFVTFQCFEYKVFDFQANLIKIFQQFSKPAKTLPLSPYVQADSPNLLTDVILLLLGSHGRKRNYFFNSLL